MIAEPTNGWVGDVAAAGRAGRAVGVAGAVRGPADPRGPGHSRRQGLAQAGQHPHPQTCRTQEHPSGVPLAELYRVRENHQRHQSGQERYGERGVLLMTTKFYTDVLLSADIGNNYTVSGEFC